VDKIKSVLPFQALPMFDLALDQDTADLGPNEVSKKTIEDTSVSANNPFDKATPGADDGHKLCSSALQSTGEDLIWDAFYLGMCA
jgi:hypothetical protein